jgi:hypothetical protein
MTADERKAYNKQYRERNKEKLSALNKEYRERNKEEIRARRTSEEFKAHRRATRNLELNRISCRKYYADNYETKIKPKRQEYYTRPEVIARIKEYRRVEYRTKGIKRGKQKIAEVEPRYVKELLRQNGILKGVPIPEALIEAKRLQLLIKRRIKNEHSNRTER